MALKFDPKQAEGNFTLLPEGEYEAFISAIDVKQSSNGNEMLVVNYKVRDDYEQEGQGQQIRFDNFVNTEAAHWRFHALNKALNVEEGAEWDNYEEWSQFLRGKAVRIVVKHEEATFGKNKGKIFPQVSGFKASEVGGEMPSAKEAADSIPNTQIDIDSDDLPF